MNIKVQTSGECARFVPSIDFKRPRRRFREARQVHCLLGLNPSRKILKIIRVF